MSFPTGITSVRCVRGPKCLSNVGQSLFLKNEKLVIVSKEITIKRYWALIISYERLLTKIILILKKHLF